MDKVRQNSFWEGELSFSAVWFRIREREEGEERESFQVLFSSILEVLPIGIRRAKSESSSTQQVLQMGTKKEGFH